MDKACGYLAQGIVALFRQRIEGSFASDLGFPDEHFGERTQNLGLLTHWLNLPPK